MSFRALVIAYDFPPHGAIGTMRTLRLVRQLRASGWRVSVLTGSPKTYLPDTPVEPDLEGQVPAGVDVLQVRAIRPFRALEDLVRGQGGRNFHRAADVPRTAAAVAGRPEDSKGSERLDVPRKGRQSRWVSPLISVKDFVEAALDIPDKESGWIAPAVVRAVWQMLRHGRPDVIYSSAPPWSGQAVALVLAAVTRRPWVADFRDPWARAPWRDWRRPFRQRAAAFLERRVVGGAEAVLFVTAANLNEFSQFYGAEAADRFHLVPNGCDPSELEALVPLPPRDPFVLLHAGTLYGPRTPMPVIQAVARAVGRGAVDATRFRLRLLGPVSLSVDLPGECRKLGLEDVVEFVPRVTRGESLREMKSASALLLIQTGTTVSVPGKAYEYLAAGRPVLALTEEGETAALVRASGVGVAVRPDAQVEAIEAALLEVMALAGRPFAPAPPGLFDGRLHADTTMRLLSRYAGPGQPRTDAGAAAPTTAEDPRQ